MTIPHARIDRFYSGPQDLESILEFLKKVRPPARLNDHPSNVDLQELLQSPLVQANTRVWFDGGNMIAFALVDEYNNLLFDCSIADFKLLGDEIVQWGVDCLQVTDARSLDTSCRESDQTRIAFLERQGFRRTSVETISMGRDLNQPIPEPALPNGFSIRSVQGEEDATALAELHRAAFGTDHVTTEARLSWMRVPEYDPSLDLIVLAPDGSFAAYCMCSISNEEDRSAGQMKGQTDPVATHPRYRKLGLARALLLHGLRLLKERGMETAALGTSDDNIPMQKAASSVGFTISHKIIWFEKAIK